MATVQAQILDSVTTVPFEFGKTKDGSPIYFLTVEAASTNPTTTQYKMRAELLIAPYGFVFWNSPNTPDMSGNYSGYAPQNLAHICVIEKYNT